LKELQKNPNYDTKIIDYLKELEAYTTSSQNGLKLLLEGVMTDEY